MAELKTKKTKASVAAFLNGIPDEQRRRDCTTVAKIMREVTGETPAMWGDAMVGYGAYTYRYASGRTGTWFRVGFAPRKQDLTLYLMSGYEGKEDLLAELGPHRLGKSCLYVKKLDGIDLDALRTLLADAYERTVDVDLTKPS